MIKQAIKILLSIVVGVLLMKLGYIFENDYLSIITQAIGYIVVSYPFILFFKVFINQVKQTIFDFKKNKAFKNIKGAVEGRITVGLKPLSFVDCVVRNSDGANNEYTKQWYVMSDKNGNYRIEHIPSGKYLIEFTKVFYNGSSMIQQRNFEIKNDETVKVDLKIVE